MEEKKQRKPRTLKAQDKVLSYHNVRLEKEQLTFLKDNAPTKNLSDYLRDVLNEGIQVVNVRQDGLTIQVCAFTDAQNKKLERYAKRFGITVNEAINEIIDLKFK